MLLKPMQYTSSSVAPAPQPTAPPQAAQSGLASAGLAKRMSVQETRVTVPAGRDRAALHTDMVAVNDQGTDHTFQLSNPLHPASDPQFDRPGLPAQTITAQQITTNPVDY